MEITPLKEADISAEVLKVVHAVIVVLDTDARIVMFNTAAEILTGYSFNEVKGKQLWNLFLLPEEIEGVRKVFTRLRSGDFPNSHTNYWITKDGEHRLIEWSNTVMLDNKKDVKFVIGTGIDITEKRQAEKELDTYHNRLEMIVEQRTIELNRTNKQLARIACMDSTTGIHNRRHFNETLETELRRCKRSKHPLSLLMCDVDYFKNYNDTYGHVAGDKCLRKIASTLDKAIKRASDLVARYGGEEFAIILPNNAENEAVSLAEKLRKEIQQKKLPHRSSPINDFVTISIGVVTKQAKDISTNVVIISAADKALYQAKGNGRNRVQAYSSH